MLKQVQHDRGLFSMTGDYEASPEPLPYRPAQPSAAASIAVAAPFSA